MSKMLDWVSNALSSVNAAREITSSLVTLRDEALVRDRVFALTNNLMDLQQQMMTAQHQQMEMLETIRELKAALAMANEKADLVAKYQRHKFVDGTFAYKLKDNGQVEEPEYFVCSNCMESENVVTLQRIAVGNTSFHRCPRCTTNVNKIVRRTIVQPTVNHWGNK
jgi:hypothetical protein